MPISSKLTKAVEKAFKAVGDQVKQGSLTQVTTSGFNFATGSNETVSSAPVIVDLIEGTTQKGDGAFETKTIYLKDPSLDLSKYSTLTIAGVPHKILSYTKNDFYVKAEVSKET